MPIQFPNVRDTQLSDIWYESASFNLFRGDDWMPDMCQSCPDKERDYGGCRCQAFMLTGDAKNADPVCGKSPYHYLIEEARANSETPVPFEELRFRNPKNSKLLSQEQLIPTRTVMD